MYRTCLFCHKDLGQNDVVEALPIGRRLAFDAARGRLWVVCRGCERWNLTPFDERWEAIEACERAYRDARRRFATDQIGIARLREGLELVRIGEPLRPEFAAWRYGDQFGRRRRRAWALGAGFAVVAIGGMAANIFVVGGGIAVQAIDWAFQFYMFRRRMAVIEPEAGNPIGLNWAQVALARFDRDSTAGNPVLMVQSRTKGFFAKPTGDWLRLEGPAALAAAGPVLAAVNIHGARAKVVASAAARLDHLPPGETMFGQLATEAARKKYAPELGHLDKDLRLALEMAANEDTERVWLAGELLDLEQAWQRAEELAAIADPLATEHLTEQLDALKERRR